jgi:hypothetical protein
LLLLQFQTVKLNSAPGALIKCLKIVAGGGAAIIIDWMLEYCSSWHIVSYHHWLNAWILFKLRYCKLFVSLLAVLFCGLWWVKCYLDGSYLVCDIMICEMSFFLCLDVILIYVMIGMGTRYMFQLKYFDGLPSFSSCDS